MKDSSLQFDIQNNLLLLPSSVSSMSVWRMGAPRLLLLLTVSLHLQSHHTRYLLVKTNEDGTASRRSNLRNKAYSQPGSNKPGNYGNNYGSNEPDNGSFEPDCSCEPYAPDCFC